MLVLESLEKAEVEVANELLGEAPFTVRIPGGVSHRSPPHAPHTGRPSQGFLQRLLPPAVLHPPGRLLWAWEGALGRSGPSRGRKGVPAGKWRWCLNSGRCRKLSPVPP